MLKAGLLGKLANLKLVLRFGVPAVVAPGAALGLLHHHVLLADPVAGQRAHDARLGPISASAGTPLSRAPRTGEI